MEKLVDLEPIHEGRCLSRLGVITNLEMRKAKLLKVETDHCISTIFS